MSVTEHKKQAPKEVVLQDCYDFRYTSEKTDKSGQPYYMNLLKASGHKVTSYEL